MLFRASAEKSSNIEDRRGTPYREPTPAEFVGNEFIPMVMTQFQDVVWGTLSGAKPTKLQGGPKNPAPAGMNYRPPVGGLDLPSVPQALPTGGIVMQESATMDAEGDLVWEYGPTAEYMPVRTRDEIAAYRMRRIQVSKNMSGK